MPPEDPEQNRWFVEQILPHETMLRSWLLGRFSTAGEVDDILQETYLRACEVHDRGKLFAPKAFLFTTARNLAIDRNRRRNRHQCEPLADSSAANVIDETESVPDRLVRKQEIALLNQAIATLPEKCREIFVMRRIKGHSQEQIARTLGLSTNTVSAQLSIGLRKCSKFLERYRTDGQ